MTESTSSEGLGSRMVVLSIHNMHNPIMQSVLGGSLHKNNTSYLLLGLHHASLNRISIVLMQITPQDERYYGICASSEYLLVVQGMRKI